MTIAQSPLSALRASSGDWLIVTLGLQEISSLLILRPEDLYSPAQFCSVPAQPFQKGLSGLVEL